MGKVLNEDILDTIKNWINGFSYVPQITNLTELSDGIIVSYLIVACLKSKNDDIGIKELTQEERYKLIDMFFRGHCKIKEGFNVDKFKEGDLFEISKISFIILFNGITSSVEEFEIASNKLDTYQNQLIQNFYELIEKLKAPTPPRELKIYEDFLFTPKSPKQTSEPKSTKKDKSNKYLIENRSATNTSGNLLVSPMQKVSITPGRPPIRKKSINEEYFHEKRRLEKELLEKNNQIEDMQYQITEKEEKFKELERRIEEYRRKLTELNNYKEKALDYENSIDKIRSYEKEIKYLEDKISKMRQSNEVLDDLQKKYDSQLSQLSCLNEQLDKLQTKDRLHQKELDRLRKIENDYHHYREGYHTKEKEILELIGDKKAIKIQLDDTISSFNRYKHDSKEQLEEMEAQVVDKQNKINYLNAKYETLEEEFNAIKRELKDIDTEYTLLKDEIAQMNEITTKEKAEHVKQILSLEAQLREMGEQVDDLKILNNRLENDIKRLNEHNSQLKNDCKAKDKTIGELNQIKNKQEDDLNVLKRKYEELNVNYAEISQNFANLKKINQEKCNEIETLHDVIKNKQQEMEKMAHKYDSELVEKENQIKIDFEGRLNELENRYHDSLEKYQQLQVEFTAKLSQFDGETNVREKLINELKELLDQEKSQVEILKQQLDELTNAHNQTKESLDRLQENYSLLVSEKDSHSLNFNKEIEKLKEIIDKHVQQAKEITMQFEQELEAKNQIIEDHIAKVNEKSEEICNLRETLAELEQKNSSNQELIESYKLKLEEKVNQFEDLKVALSESQRNGSETLEQLQSEIKNKNEMIDCLKKDVNVLNEKCEFLGQQMRLMEENAVNSQTLLNTKEQELAELQVIKAKNEQELLESTEKSVKFKELYESLEVSLGDLKAKHEDLIKERDEQFSKFQNENEKCESLSEQIKLLEANAISSQAILNTKEQELTELKALKAKNEQEIHELTDKNIQLKGLYERMEQSLNELKTRHENLIKERDEQLSKFNETVTNLDMNLENVKKLNEELINKHQNQLKDLADQRQRELSLFESETQQRDRKIQELEGRLHAENTENTVLAAKFETEVRNLQAVIGEHSRLNEALKTDLATKDENFKKLQANFDALISQKNDEHSNLNNELNRLNARLQETLQQRELAELRLNEAKAAGLEEKTLVGKYQNQLDLKITEYNTLVLNYSSLQAKCTNFEYNLNQKTAECDMLVKRLAESERKAQIESQSKPNDYEKIKQDLAESKQLVASFERHFKEKEIELVKLYKELEVYRENAIKADKLQEENSSIRNSLNDKEEEIKRLTVGHQEMNDYIKKFESHYQSKKVKFQQCEMELRQKVDEVAEKETIIRLRDDELNKLKQIENDYDAKLKQISRENVQLKTSIDYLERKLRENEKRESIDYNSKINPSFKAYNPLSNQSLRHPISNPNFASSTILKTPQPKQFNDDSLVKYSSPDLKTNDLFICSQDIDTRRVSIDTISSFRTNANSTLSSTQNQNAFNNRFEAISESDFEAALNSNKYLPFETDNNRLSMLQARNQKQKPHLKSSYPLEVDLGLNNASTALKNREIYKSKTNLKRSHDNDSMEQAQSENKKFNVKNEPETPRPSFQSKVAQKKDPK